MAANHPIDWISAKESLQKHFQQKNFQTSILSPEKPFKPLHDPKPVYLHEISEEFNTGMKESPFSNAGIAIDGKFYSCKVETDFKGKNETLGDILLPSKEIDEEFLIKAEDLTGRRDGFISKVQKKKRERALQDSPTTMPRARLLFPDALDRPSRLIITGEGVGASRFKHVVCFEMTKQRRNQNDEVKEHVAKVRQQLGPCLERVVKATPSHRTRAPEHDARRPYSAYCVKKSVSVGNALVVGIIMREAIEIGAWLKS